MNSSLLGLWLVCGLGSAVFAAVRPMSRRGAALCAVAFAAGTWSALRFAESAPFVGSIAAFAAAAFLIRPRYSWLAPIIAGLLGGMWVPVIESLRVPFIPAMVLSAAVLIVAARRRRADPGFAPDSMCEEALLVLLAISLVLAAAPAVVDGWHAAANLKLQGPAVESASNGAIPMWTLTAAAAALMSGGLYSMWSRR